MSNSQVLRGIVKGVPSGDSLLIFSPLKNRKPKEYLLSLSGIRAPRLAVVTSSSPEEIGSEEPFAWESREFLRKAALGKTVEFVINSTLNRRSFGFASVLTGPETRLDLHSHIVSKGWAKYQARESRYKKKVTKIDGYDEVKTEMVCIYKDDNPLVELQEKAEDRGIGIFSNNKSAGTRSIIGYNYDPNKALRKFGNSKVKVLIERINSPTSIEFIVLNSNLHIKARISGIQTPYRFDSKGALGTIREITKLFLESRLLHRVVEISIHRFFVNKDESSTFEVTIHHPKGSIRRELITKGFAQLDVRAAETIPIKKLQELRSIQEKAQEKRLGIWKNITPTKDIKTSQSSFFGIVHSVLSGDSLMILRPVTPSKVPLIPNSIDRMNPDSWTIERVALSSIRAPRYNSRDQKKCEPFGQQAREFLRKISIGQPVLVTIDYTRDIEIKGQDTVTQNYATVSLLKRPEPEAFRPTRTIAASNKRRKKRKGISMGQSIIPGNPPYNLAKVLISQGLAQVIFHKAADPKSSDYDVLLMSHTQSKKASLGLFSPKIPPPTIVPAELDSTGSAVNLFYAEMSKTETMNGVVEHVVSSNRIKISTKKTSFFLSLDGLWTPSRKAKNKTPENAAAAAQSEHIASLGLFFVTSLLHQRQVLFSLTRIEKSTQLYGDILFVHPNGTTKSLSEELLSLGFAKLWIRRPPTDPLSIAQKYAFSNNLLSWKLEEPFDGPNTVKKTTNQTTVEETFEEEEEEEEPARNDDIHIRLQSGEREMAQYFGDSSLFTDTGDTIEVGSDLYYEEEAYEDTNQKDAFTPSVRRITAAPRDVAYQHPVMNPNPVSPSERTIVVVNNGPQIPNPKAKQIPKTSGGARTQNNQRKNVNQTNRPSRPRQPRQPRQKIKAARL